MADQLVRTVAASSQESSSMAKHSNMVMPAASEQSATPSKPDDPIKPSLFDRLPGEIRNEIYRLVYATKRTVNMRPDSEKSRSHPLHHTRQPAVAKATRCLSIVPSQKGTFYNKTINVSKVPGQKRLPSINDVRWASSPISLLLTCKTISAEAGTILYANTSFFFEDPRRLSAFLIHTHPRNLLAIQNLSIHYQAYGRPCLVANIQWEHKHLEQWKFVLTMVADRVSNLKSLSLDLHFGHLESFLSRAFRNPDTCKFNSKLDAGPLLLTMPLAKLKHLQSVHLRTSSNVLSMSRDTDRFQEAYKPQFAIQGISTPSQQQKDVVFKDNLTQVEEVHRTLNGALRRLMRGEVDLEATFAEMLVVFSERKEWLQDPVGNSLRRANMPALSVIRPPGPIAVAAANATFAANPAYTAPVEYIMRPWTELDRGPYTPHVPKDPNFRNQWTISKRKKTQKRPISEPEVELPLLTTADEDEALLRKQLGSKKSSTKNVHHPNSRGLARGTSVDSAVDLTPANNAGDKQSMSALELLTIEMATPAQLPDVVDGPAKSVEHQAHAIDTAPTLQPTPDNHILATSTDVPTTRPTAPKRSNQTQLSKLSDKDKIKFRTEGRCCRCRELGHNTGTCPKQQKSKITTEAKLKLTADKKPRNVNSPQATAGPSSPAVTKDGDHSARNNSKKRDKGKGKQLEITHNEQARQIETSAAIAAGPSSAPVIKDGGSSARNNSHKAKGKQLDLTQSNQGRKIESGAVISAGTSSTALVRDSNCPAHNGRAKGNTKGRATKNKTQNSDRPVEKDEPFPLYVFALGRTWRTLA